MFIQLFFYDKKLMIYVLKQRVKFASVMKWKVLICFREDENCCATPGTL